LRSYELMYILNPELEEEGLEGVRSKVEDLITGTGGQLLQMDSWGIRRLAYRIRGFREGRYVLARVKLEPAGILDLRRGLGLMEEVIRYLLVRTEEDEIEPAEETPVLTPEPAAPVEPTQ
jgi:small subunit ribosomal protein S6